MVSTVLVQDMVGAGRELSPGQGQRCGHGTAAGVPSHARSARLGRMGTESILTVAKTFSFLVKHANVC